MDIEKALEEIRDQATKDVEFSRELAIKFFFHWALLSGAAITLFIPFLSSDIVQDNITSSSRLYIKITFISLVVSTLFSSIRNFIMMKGILRLGQEKHKIANELKEMKPGERKKMTIPKHEQISEVLGYVAIFAFFVGIISAYLFVSKVIL